MEFNNEESDELIKNEFFIIDSDNLEAIESKLYGYMITDASPGPTTISAAKLGRFFIQFQDYSKYEINL